MSQSSFSFAVSSTEARFTNALLVRDVDGQYRVASADDGFFDKVGGIFGDVKPMLGRGDESHATRLPQDERRTGVLAEEDALQGRRVGLRLGDQPLQLAVQRREAGGERTCGGITDGPKRDSREAIPL